MNLSSGFEGPGQRKPLVGFIMSDMNGKTWDLADHRGKVVFINFWATWCPPCQAETSDLVDVAQQYAGKGIVAVGVTMDQNNAEGVRQFIEQYHIPYPILQPRANSPLVSQIDAIPVTVLIDRQGRIAQTFTGRVSAEDLRSVLDRLLAER